MAEGPKRKLKRAEKADENRKALFEAAAHVVGRHGYANASIGKITEKAGLAQGTFYLYFESRQDLFDQLLPTIGEEMLDYVRDSIRGSRDLIEMEERGLTAFFDFLTKKKGFFRILYETDMVSPSAAEKHYSLIARRYEGVMRRALEGAQIRPLTTVETEVLTYLMMGARDYLYRYAIQGKPKGSANITEIVQAYISILKNGIGVREGQ